MRLKRLTVADFRNYPQLRVEFSPGLNYIYGPNGAGKTNLLEAIYYLGTGRGLRTRQDSELIRWGADRLQVTGIVCGQREDQEIHIYADRKPAKWIKVNGIAQKRLSDLLGRFGVVAFLPDDLQLVKGAPITRRRFLDETIVQIRPLYYQRLKDYWHALAQRNNLLKQIRGRRVTVELLPAWDEQLVETGTAVISERRRWVGELGPLVTEAAAAISGRAETLLLAYQPALGTGTIAEPPTGWSPGAIRARLVAALTHGRKDELERGHTLAGPHRDDLFFSIDGSEARLYASQGQQRTIALACRVAQVELLHRETGQRPTLLLDDVFSELDAVRAAALLKEVRQGAQVFITATDNSNAMVGTTGPMGYLYVRPGEVIAERAGDLEPDPGTNERSG